MGERSEIESYLAILSYMTAEMRADPRLPELVESYRDFEPPANFKQVVETLLAYVPPKYLVGLKTIILGAEIAKYACPNAEVLILERQSPCLRQCGCMWTIS